MDLLPTYESYKLVSCQQKAGNHQANIGNNDSGGMFTQVKK